MEIQAAAPESETGGNEYMPRSKPKQKADQTAGWAGVIRGLKSRAPKPGVAAISDSRPSTGSAPELNREQIEILDHTERRAAGGFYCGGGKEMDALVEAGLMEYAGRKSFVPDPYYRITGRGREALKKAQNAKVSNSGEAAQG